MLKYNQWILVLLVIASLGLAGGILKLEVSHNMDEYFPASGEDFQAYTQYREIFGEDDHFLLISIESDSGIYEKKFLDEIKTLKSSLRNLPGIIEVFWIDDQMPAKLRLRKSLVERLATKGLFVSEDEKSAALLILHEHLERKDQMLDLMNEIKQVLKLFEDDKIRIAGKIYLTVALEKFMKEDSAWLFVMTLCLVVGILWLVLGSIRLLLISLAVPVCSIVFTLGLMGNLGFHINLFTTMVPTLILIISVSDIIHIVKGAGPHDPRQRVMYHLVALLLTTLTTAIGFASLMTTQIPVIMEFGAFVAIGVLYTFFFTIALFSLSKIRTYQKVSWLDQSLDLSIAWVKRNYRNQGIRVVILVSFAVFIVAGISKIRTNAFMVTGVPDNSDIKQEALHFDQEFAGIRPLSIFVERKDSRIEVSKAVFEKLDSLIQSHIGTRFLLGPHQLDIISIPVRSEDGRYYRYYGLMKDIGSQKAIQKFDSLAMAIDADPDFAELSVFNTGIGKMLDENTTQISQSIEIGLFVAMTITFILLSFYFKGMGEALISIVVNIIPLLMLASAFGLLGIELRAGTSVAFSIAFGIAIDDTMHMLATYKKCKTSGESFDRVILDSGKPVLMTTLVFALSFSVLIFSGLEAVSVLGLSMVIGGVSALLSDLFILPGMLSLLSK